MGCRSDSQPPGGLVMEQGLLLVFHKHLPPSLYGSGHNSAESGLLFVARSRGFAPCPQGSPLSKLLSYWIATLITYQFVAGDANVRSIFLFRFFYWRTVDLQCTNLCCTASDSVIHMYTNIKKEKCYICFHYDLSLGIDHSSLCYTLELCSLSILYLIACICQPPTPRPSISLPLPPLITTCLCSVCESVSTRQKQMHRYSEVNFFLTFLFQPILEHIITPFQIPFRYFWQLFLC